MLTTCKAGYPPRQQKVCQVQQGPLTSYSSACCIACLHFCAEVQAACRPHLLLHHRPRCRIAGRQREASLAAQQAAAVQAEERGALSNFAMQLQLLHRPPCHALLLRPQLLTAYCCCTAKQQPDSTALHSHCNAVSSRAMHTASPNALCHALLHNNRLKPASTQLRPHSAVHQTCIALHTHRRMTLR